MAGCCPARFRNGHHGGAGPGHHRLLASIKCRAYPGRSQKTSATPVYINLENPISATGSLGCFRLNRHVQAILQPIFNHATTRRSTHHPRHGFRYPFAGAKTSHPLVPSPPPRQHNHTRKNRKRGNKAKLPYTATAIFCQGFGPATTRPDLAIVAPGDS